MNAATRRAPPDDVMTKVLLASKSPRRQALLRQLGVDFAVLDVDVPEVPRPGQSPIEYAVSVAAAKARAGAIRAGTESVVLGADTDVSIDGEILGKPPNPEHAAQMLLRLSAREHQVCSAVAIVHGGELRTALSVTTVEFGPISEAAAIAYAETGEPLGKAGAYAIQGYAARWIRSINGSYSGVVGLPLFETAALLDALTLTTQPPTTPPNSP